MKEFVNLHCHTSIGSTLDAIISVDDLFDEAKKLGQKAVGVTDHGTMAAHLDAFKAYKRTGVKFIPGFEAYFVHSYDEFEEGKRIKTEKRKHIVLLAQNEIGYKNLLKINFYGFENKVVSMGRIFPRISWDAIKKYSKGIICTSACANGPMAALIRNEKYNEAVEVAIKFQEIFEDRFYIELHPHLLKADNIDQNEINKSLITISQKLGIPLICTADTHYLSRDHEKYHDVLMAINSKAPVDDPNRHRYGIDEFYVKNGDEVYNFLNKHYGEDVAEEAVSNTVNISNLCLPPDYIEIDKVHLPIFDPKKENDYKEFLEWTKNITANIGEDSKYLRFKVFESFKNKFNSISKEERKERMDRIKKEILVFEKNNFSSYILIVADYIKWAKDNNILVGCGRGSVGGSFVAYLLGIHTVDPFKYNLLFERFQNSEKKDLPDIDTDFTSAGRDLVKQYCINKYGKEHCAQVSNINTYTPKNVIPDLVKSMRNVIIGLVPDGINYVSVSEAIKAAIPDEDEDGNRIENLNDALSLSPKLRNFASKFPELMEYANIIIGLPKEYSSHAAGLVLSDIPLVNFVPLRIDKNDIVSVQYEKTRCEKMGLVKMDFLAISTLDVIDETFKNIKRLNIKGPEKMEDIPLDDKETYKMIQEGHTKCVFQLGKSGSMAILCKQIRPSNISDIAIINALGRPSSKDERQIYIDRKFKGKEIKHLHPSLKCLDETQGLCILEEQLMAVAKDVAGWSLNKADGLRKLTKLKGKDPDFVLKLEADFISGAIKTHDMSYELGKEIWNKVVEKFQGYGFNKAHAIFYSINGYYTAYLKRHFPAAFMAAYLKIKSTGGGLNKDDEISTAKTECKRLDIKILPPNINKSSIGYEILDENTIVMGFTAIKGLGEKAVTELVNKQPYTNFIDIIRKTEGRTINKSKLEALAMAGAFDCFNIPRKQIFENGKTIRDKFNVWNKKQSIDGDNIDFPLQIENEEWDRKELLQKEQEVLGDLITGTFQDMFPGFFTNIGVTPISRLSILPDRQELVVELIIKMKLREFKIKSGKYKGQLMIKYRVMDVFGTETELTIWPSKYDEAKKLLKDGMPVRAYAQNSIFNGEATLMLREIEKIYTL
jgi:DNA polymerase-3 subunit alpha